MIAREILAEADAVDAQEDEQSVTGAATSCHWNCRWAAGALVFDGSGTLPGECASSDRSRPAAECRMAREAALAWSGPVAGSRHCCAWCGRTSRRRTHRGSLEDHRAGVAAMAYFVSPVDLIPDFIRWLPGRRGGHRLRHRIRSQRLAQLPRVGGPPGDRHLRHADGRGWQALRLPDASFYAMRVG